MTYKSLKQLIDKYGKTNKQIAEEIKDFCLINSGYSDFEYPQISNVLYWKIRTEQVEKIIKEYEINKIFEGAHEFYAYYADYDWVAFCWLFGKMVDLPEGFPMYCNDLKQELDRRVNDLDVKSGLKKLKSREDYPKQTNEHNALADAKWNFKLYKFLQAL